MFFEGFVKEFGIKEKFYLFLFFVFLEVINV